MRTPIRSYLAFLRSDAPADVVRAYFAIKDRETGPLLSALFGPENAQALRRDVLIAGVPSRNFSLRLPSDAENEGVPPTPDRVDTLIVAFSVTDPSALEHFRELMARLSWNARLGTDLPLSNAGHWCPNTAQPLFGSRADARRSIRAAALPGQSGLVNVVMVDEGLNGGQLGEHYGGGWIRCDPLSPSTPPKVPGSTPGGHGEMTGRNVLDLATGARLFDMPLIPLLRPPLLAFLSDAHAAFAAIRADIDWLVTNRPQKYGQSWVICNAWAVYSTEDDTHAPFYSSDITHPFNIEAGLMVDAGHDTVFAAGNCGTFCPHPRCGRQDRGAGRSILGANGHPRVVSVGSVRTDGNWLGYASEGPGLIECDKPDVCAPSSFHEDHDFGLGNSGTSAACAVVVGVIAAFRSESAKAGLSPDAFKTAINRSARPVTGQSGFSGRYGHGVIDAERLRAQLP